MNVTLHRFGRKRRLVLMLEWLTLWPTSGPLAVSSQRRDMLKYPLPSPAARRAPEGVKICVLIGSARTYRGDRAKGQGFAPGEGTKLAVSAADSVTYAII